MEKSPIMDIWSRILEILWKRSRFVSYFFQTVHFVQEETIPTLALTLYSFRLTLFFNIDFIMSLDDEELIGLLVHEMMHVILNHSHRESDGGNIYLQNLAQDMVINSFIIKRRENFFSRKGSYSADVPQLILPEGLPCIPEIFYAETRNEDPSWENIYRWLKDQPEKGVITMKNSGIDIPSQNRTNGMTVQEHLDEVLKNPLDIPVRLSDEMPVTSFGNIKGLYFKDGDDTVLPTGAHILQSRDEMTHLESKKKHIMALAEQDFETEDERALHEIRAYIKKVNTGGASSWQRQLKSIVDFSAQSNEWEYTSGRFNRRYFGNGIYAPGRIFKEEELLTVVVDVSASMVMKSGEIEAAFGVIEELLVKYRIHLLCIDENLFIPQKEERGFAPSTVHDKPYLYKKGDWKYIRSGSSGTTFFSPLFNRYLKGHHEMLLIITDGYIYDMERLSRYASTLWVISSGRTAPFNPPFGRVVTIEGN